MELESETQIFLFNNSNTSPSQLNVPTAHHSPLILLFCTNILQLKYSTVEVGFHQVEF